MGSRAALDTIVSLEGHLNVLDQLTLLGMTEQEKRRLLSLIGSIISARSKRRITTQTDLAGRPFTPRKRKSKRKMLVGFRRKIAQAVDSADESVTVFVKGRQSPYLAKRHQEGFEERISKRDWARKRDAGEGEMATRRQAKALKALGFRWPWCRKGGKKGIKRSQKWIMANLKREQAGAIVRAMRGEAGKSSWTVKVPARSMLGVDQKGYREILDMVKESVFKTEAINY